MNMAGFQSTVILPGLHNLLRELSPQALWMGRPGKMQIALTFDDGPHPADTPKLLDVLDRWKIRATFFQVGENAEKYPELTRVVSEKHLIGLHGYYHRPMLLGSYALQQELDYTRSMMASATGRSPGEFKYVRPPFGVYTPLSLARLGRWGFRPVMWSLVPLHWIQDFHHTIQQVNHKICDGTILILHEALGGPPVADLANAILPRLLQAGYQFVTIDQFWSDLFNK